MNESKHTPNERQILPICWVEEPGFDLTTNPVVAKDIRLLLSPDTLPGEDPVSHAAPRP